MSIQSEISRIIRNVADAYSALAAKGATLPDAQNTDNLASTIESIQAGEAMSIETIWAICGYEPVVPTGYTLLNYIQSTGTQYIDTGFKPNQNTRVVMDVGLPSISSLKALFGGRDGDTSSENSFIFWQFSSTTFRTDFDTHDLTITVESTEGRFLIDKNKSVTTINGVEHVNNSAEFQSNYSVGLFTLLDPGGPDKRMASGKIYSCQIYDNGTLIRDFVPCINPDGVYGLYDKVNKQFYGNAGSGSFTGA